MGIDWAFKVLFTSSNEDYLEWAKDKIIFTSALSSIAGIFGSYKLTPKVTWSKLSNETKKKIGEAQKGLENTVKPNEQEVQKMRDEIKTNREKYNAELKKILTSEQYAKYEQQQKDRMKQFGDRQRGNRGGHDDMTKPQE